MGAVEVKESPERKEGSFCLKRLCDSLSAADPGDAAEKHSGSLLFL